MEEIKICVVCGKEYISHYPINVTCSQKCADERKKILNADREKMKRQKKDKRTNHEKIADITVEARKHGMSYGEYVAQKGL